MWKMGWGVEGGGAVDDPNLTRKTYETKYHVTKRCVRDMG